MNALKLVLLFSCVGLCWVGPLIRAENPGAAAPEDTIFCGTSLVIGESLYEEFGDDYREQAREAEARGDAICHGDALLELAKLEYGRYRRDEGDRAFHEARRILGTVLSAEDPRWIAVLRVEAESTSFADRARVYRRLIPRLEATRRLDEPVTFAHCNDRRKVEPLDAWHREQEARLIETWTSLGIVRKETGELVRATEALETALLLFAEGRFKDPAEAIYRGRLMYPVGRAVVHLGEIAETRADLVTVEALERVVAQLEALDAGKQTSYAIQDALQSLAAVRAAAGDTSAQEQILREAVTVAEEQDAASRSLAVGKLAKLLEEQGRLDETEALLLELSSGKDVAGSASSSQLESFYLRNRRDDDLGDLLERRLIDEPESWSVLHRLGALENRRGNHGRAVDLLKRCLQVLKAGGIAPDNTNLASVEEQLARAFRGSGREAAAVRAEERAFEIRELSRLKQREAGKISKPWMFQGSIVAALRLGKIETAKALLVEMEASLGNAPEYRRHSELSISTVKARLAAAEGRRGEALTVLKQVAAGYGELQAEQPIRLKYSLYHLENACREMDLSVDCALF